MTCPLKFNSKTLDEYGYHGGHSECETTNCAWWSVGDTMCNIKSVSIDICETRKLLDTITNIMANRRYD